MLSLGMPAAIIVSIMGRRNRRFGTGRVISQIRMQALFRPCASVASGGASIGLSKAAWMAPVWCASFGKVALRITVASARSGRPTVRCPRPKAISTVLYGSMTNSSTFLIQMRRLPYMPVHIW